jgi:uncharacterized protein (DUF2252 family)
VNSFGTWRDLEGRLCWGVDDFDESYWLPYTNDLVRLGFRNNCLRSASVLSGSVPYRFCKPPNLLLGFCEGYVDLEGIFGRDRFAHAVRNNGIVIEAACELVEARAIAAEVIFEIGNSRRYRSPTVAIPTAFMGLSGMRPTGSGRRSPVFRGAE